MTQEMNYSSVLTGASFMLYEFKQVAALKEQGLSDAEIRKKAIDENLFQHEKISSLQRGFPSILRRVNALDEELLKLLANESLETAKVINLYAIMKTDRLFHEFMIEVIEEKFQNNDYTIEKKDVNTYFTTKAEQHESIANWKEATIQKLKLVYMNILLGAGLLESKKTGELNRLIIDDQIKDHLRRIGDARYLQAMGE
ncbi:DUF1819 family protein [Planococcus lenghuensis]|uniref:DUF1819 family protein n=1 Tax=Planococcus lenghuensis TaxID=2213202 RepID=A0A1Q2KVL6_9BACL|nr:DUF1819 family protein [Planococcus lenghuensis]AQQ52240.1 hypothetical protein B0X71_03350 [Planococcus lenghuensis]